MLWLGKEIPLLTNQELTEASEKLIEMQNYRNEQLIKKKRRHETIDLTNTNPPFEELKRAIGQEIVDRGL